MTKRLRINDLAKILNLSHSTVGAALSGSSGNTRVSEATRQRVQEAARKLHYKVNTSARAVREQRFNNIGFFTVKWGPDDYTWADLMSHGIAMAAEARGQRVSLVRISEEMIARGAIPAALRDASLDALVVQDASHIPAAFQEAITSLDIPVVFANEKRERNAIYFDDVEAGRLVTRHLIGQGFRKIALFAPHKDQPHYSTFDRIAGYRAAMAEAGLEPLVKKASFIPAEWREDAERWLRDPAARPEAVFCIDDTVGLYFQRVLYRLNIRVPDAMGLAAVGDEILAKHSTIPLTTAKLDIHGLAQAAVAMAVRLVDEGLSELPSVVLRPTLTVRESSERPA